MSFNPFGLNDPDYPYVIAEIGNNHQGSFDKALKLIDEAKWAGADAVKFQKRCNEKLFVPSFYDSPYKNDNSFADTYGEHRESLELSIEEMLKLKEYCDQINLTFFATPFDVESLNQLEDLKLPFYKVASADIINTPLLEKISKTGKNVIISTGHSTYDDVERAINCFNSQNKLVILHCTAAYPAPIDSMNLRCIPELIKRYPDHIIGISDHENGIDAASIAYMLGARVFEKHFTLNRADKGTDHKFSLEPIGLQKLVRNLKRIPKMMGNKDKTLLEVEKKPIYKMSKSIVFSDSYSKGITITEDCLEYRCPGDGLPPYMSSQILGKKLICDVKKYDFVQKEHLAMDLS